MGWEAFLDTSFQLFRGTNSRVPESLPISYKAEILQTWIGQNDEPRYHQTQFSNIENGRPLSPRDRPVSLGEEILVCRKTSDFAPRRAAGTAGRLLEYGGKCMACLPSRNSALLQLQRRSSCMLRRWHPGPTRRGLTLRKACHLGIRSIWQSRRPHCCLFAQCPLRRTFDRSGPLEVASPGHPFGVPGIHRPGHNQET